MTCRPATLFESAAARRRRHGRRETGGGRDRGCGTAAGASKALLALLVVLPALLEIVPRLSIWRPQPRHDRPPRNRTARHHGRNRLGDNEHGAARACDTCHLGHDRRRRRAGFQKKRKARAPRLNCFKSGRCRALPYSPPRRPEARVRQWQYAGQPRWTWLEGALLPKNSTEAVHSRIARASSGSPLERRPLRSANGGRWTRAGK